MQERNHIEHYSNALFSIWNEEKFEEQKNITSKSKDIYYSLKNNYEIIKILSSNIITKKERKEILTKIYFDELNTHYSSMYLYNFLHLLIDNDFFENVLDIFISFFEKIDAFQNFIFLRIYSPYWLDQKLLERIEEIFSIKTGKKVKYENMIDKNLIGGIKILFGNQIYDYSIKGQIEQIKWNLENSKEI